MATLAEIRAKLKESESRKEGNFSNNNQDKTLYPFWNLQTGKDCVIRFLPDGNQNNTFFWVEKQTINLPFPGIKGENEDKQVVVRIPCVEMYNDGSICPITSEVRAWWNDKSLEDAARVYWKKRAYILQGFVVEDGLNEQDPPQNLIRRFTCTAQVYKLIQAILVDPELDEMPTDTIHGLDFRIKKGTSGIYADYSSSIWSRKTRPLNDMELAAIEEHGLPDLTDALPKKPTAEDLVMFKEMFEASVNGELFDAQRWAKWKPFTNNNTNTTSDTSYIPNTPVTPVATPVSAPVTAPVIEPQPVIDETATYTAPPAAPAASASKAQDILAQIRNRAA